MAKRFTDTDIWDKEWFMVLPAHHKLLMQLLYTKCDPAGVWTPNWVLASMYIGAKVTIEDLAPLSEQLEILDSGKIFIPGFIKFQYGKLSKDCKPHIPVYRLLDKHKIDIESIQMSDCIGKTHNVSEKTRVAIFNQDGFTCCYCGKQKEERNLTVDHIISRSKGGLDKPENLVASCVPCNSKKSNFSLSEFCNREGLDFELISQRVSQRVSNRLSNSLQDKEEDKEGDKGVLKGVQGEKGWNTMPTENDVTDLPELKIGSAQQFLKITKQVDVSVSKIIGMWEVFKVQNLTGTKYYQDVGAVHSHFINWIKTQKFETAKPSEINYGTNVNDRLKNINKASAA
jgi:hypothetical protein